MTATAGSRLRLRGLVVSRGVDQAVLGLASLLLARHLGPDAFAPIAVLFVLNSLAIQVSDFGVGFRVLRIEPGATLARASLARLRLVNGAVAVVAVAVGAVVGDTLGATVAGGGVIWALSAEAYVRKATALKVQGDRPVVRAELVGAVWFGAACAVGALSGVGVLGYVVAFGVKHLIEAGLTGGGLGLFTPDGSPTGASDEWVGQVLTYAVANVDFLLVGLLLGPVALSQYVIAFRMASAAPALLASPFMQAAFVDLAAADDHAARQTHFDRLVRRAWGLGVVGGAGALVLAVVIPWFLGSDWEVVGPLLVLLAFAVPWRMLLGIAVGAALTADRARSVVHWEAARLVLVGTVVAVASGFGIVAVAGGAAACAIVAIGLELRQAAHVRGVAVGRVVPAASAAALVAVAVGVVLLSG